MKKVVLISLLVGTLLAGYGQSKIPSYYVSPSQIEKALSQDWKYLHNILEEKKWIFEQVLFDSYYYFYNMNKSGQIQITASFNCEDGRKTIFINTSDEGYYWYIKGQLKKLNYKLEEPTLYRKGNYTVATFTDIDKIVNYNMNFVKHPN